MLGAFFNSMYDFKLNFKGISMGVGAAVVTSFYQVVILIFNFILSFILQVFNNGDRFLSGSE